jgi:hypothetical protein
MEDAMTLLSRRTRVAARTARRGIRTYGRAKWAQGRLTAPRHPRRRPAFLAGFGSGALLAFFMDPADGKRRRHLLRDRSFATLRRGKRETVRKADYAAGHARGAVHAVTPDSAPREPIDDVTLTRKVESEIFRDADAPKDRISVNTEHGVVYLRGEVDRPEQIESLVAGAQKVQGVERVENLLHLPGTPAPMKQ